MRMFAAGDAGGGCERRAQKTVGMRLAAHRSPRGLPVYLALTLASALLAHLAFDVADAGLFAVFSRPVHLVYALVVVAALAAAACEVYRPLRAERRRLAALARAQLRRSDALTPVLCGTAQLFVAGVTVAAEGGSVDGARLTAAVISALFAIVVGALALRSVEGAVLDAVVALCVSLDLPQSSGRSAFGRARPTLARDSLYRLFRPNRPPPSGPFSDTITFRKGTLSCLAFVSPPPCAAFSSLSSSS